MSSDILNTLLKEYEQKKLKAELDLEKRKQNLYKQIPRLEQIDNELNKLAISTTKNILNNQDPSLQDFQNKIDKLNKEKVELLKQNGFNKYYLKPLYSCSLCNDTGYITTNDYNTQMCSCLKQKLLDISFNKSNMSNLSKENFETFNPNIFSNEVDLAKYGENISPRKNIIDIKNKCIEFVKNFENPECKNLLFSGNTGLR